MVKPWLVTMKGRFIHSVDRKVTFQPYGVGDQANYSVSRSDLNSLLLTECEKLPNITLSFEEKLNSIDADGTVHSNKAGQTYATKYRFVVGADGGMLAPPLSFSYAHSLLRPNLIFMLLFCFVRCTQRSPPCVRR